MTFYTVIEVQKGDGNPAVLTYIFTEENLAYNKFYTVLAAASVSALAYHSCHILRSDGTMIESKVYNRSEE